MWSDCRRIFLWKNEEVACEVFLGTLKANDINVNEIAAEILSDSCKMHNKEHMVKTSDRIKYVRFEKSYEDEV